MLLVRTTKGTNYIMGGVSSKAFAGYKSKDRDKRDYFIDWYLLAGMSDQPHDVESLLEDLEESDFREEGYDREDLKQGIRRLFEAGYIEEYRY